MTDLNPPDQGGPRNRGRNVVSHVSLQVTAIPQGNLTEQEPVQKQAGVKVNLRCLGETRLSSDDVLTARTFTGLGSSTTTQTTRRRKRRTRAASPNVEVARVA